MTPLPSDRPVSALRARMIADMNVRGFSEKTRNDYIRNVRALAAFIGRSPDTATAEDLRRFQHHQAQTGVRPPSINSAVAALCFFFTVTLDRPDLARRLTIVREPRRLPAVLSVEEVTLLLQAAPGRRWRFSGGRDSETESSGGTHVAASERWRSGWDHEFESPLLQGGVRCEPSYLAGKGLRRRRSRSIPQDVSGALDGFGKLWSRADIEV
ncbi:MAG TPA: site-specific integrase, partial [Stellaceae bacterium]